MNCGVCILLLRALGRWCGGGGRSEEDVTEITSSGLDPSFSVAPGGGEDSESEGRKRVFWTRDVEAQVMRSARAPGRICHVAYMHTWRKGIEKYTYLYWFLVMGVICTHLDVGGGWTLLRCVCMHARAWAGTHLHWTLVSITVGTNGTHLDVAVQYQICLVFVFTRQQRMVTLVRSVDRRCMRGLLAWLRRRLS